MLQTATTSLDRRHSCSLSKEAAAGEVELTAVMLSRMRVPCHYVLLQTVATIALCQRSRFQATGV